MNLMIIIILFAVLGIPFVVSAFSEDGFTFRKKAATLGFIVLIIVSNFMPKATIDEYEQITLVTDESIEAKINLYKYEDIDLTNTNEIDCANETIDRDDKEIYTFNFYKKTKVDYLIIETNENCPKKLSLISQDGTIADTKMLDKEGSWVLKLTNFTNVSTMKVRVDSSYQEDKNCNLKIRFLKENRDDL